MHDTIVMIYYIVFMLFDDIFFFFPTMTNKKLKTKFWMTVWIVLGNRPGWGVVGRDIELCRCVFFQSTYLPRFTSRGFLDENENENENENKKRDRVAW